jgi:hypothetical protein
MHYSYLSGSQPDRRPTSRFPRLDAGPLLGVLGHPSGRKARPFCRFAAGHGVRHPPLAIQAPTGHVMRGLRPALLAGLDARVCDCPTPCPAAKRQGRGYAPGVLAVVGDGTPLNMALRSPAPPAVLVPLGRERRTGLRDAGRLSHAFGAAPYRQL